MQLLSNVLILHILRKNTNKFSIYRWHFIKHPITEFSYSKCILDFAISNESMLQRCVFRQQFSVCCNKILLYFCCMFKILRNKPCPMRKMTLVRNTCFLCMFHEHETKVFGGKRLWDRPFYMSRHSMELVILKGSHSKTKLTTTMPYSLARIQKS